MRTGIPIFRIKSIHPYFDTFPRFSINGKRNLAKQHWAGAIIIREANYRMKNDLYFLRNAQYIRIKFSLK